MRGRARLWLAIAMVPACALTPQAIAEIPTTGLSADGGPVTPPPKTAPRAEQRTTEQRPAAAPSLG